MKSTPEKVIEQLQQLRTNRKLNQRKHERRKDCNAVLTLEIEENAASFLGQRNVKATTIDLSAAGYSFLFEQLSAQSARMQGLS